MKNKTVVSDNLEKLRNSFKNYKYLVYTNGTPDELAEAYNNTIDKLDNIVHLVSLEQDMFGTFKSNQII